MTTGVKSENKPIFLVGATGTGKSALAMELARVYADSGGAAILAMDAMQVYRGANIGTSKPSAAEQAEVPHGGLDLVEFGEGFDVAQYLKHAESFLREQWEAGRQVIIVGGTGLYFRALTQGLCEAPQGSEKLRTQLNSLQLGLLQARLEGVDPEIYRQIDISNPRRLIRAIEVKEETGRSLLDWQAETPAPLVPNFRAYWIQREREELAQRIGNRVETMFAQGWVEEVRSLMTKYGGDKVKAFPGIGYREIAESFGEPDQITKLPKLPDLGRPIEGGGEPGSGTAQAETGRPGGRPSMGKVKSDILVATRQYAKRQLTWFQREPNLHSVMLSGTQPFPAALLTLT